MTAVVLPRPVGEPVPSPRRPRSAAPASGHEPSVGPRPSPARAADSADEDWASGPIAVGDTSAITFRPARPTDVAELAAMHHRCSEATLYGRYLTVLTRPPRRMLGALLATDVSIVALGEEGSILALGNLESRDPACSPAQSSAEVAVLVEDAWQSRGIGTALMRALVDAAELLGFPEVIAHSRHGQAWADRSLHALGPARTSTAPLGGVTTRLDLTMASPQMGSPAAMRRSRTGLTP